MSAPTRPPRRPPKRSAAVDPIVQLTQAFHDYCRNLTNQFAGYRGSRLVRWFSPVMTIVGVVLAFSLVYVRLQWFWFGPSMAFCSTHALLLLGDDVGRNTMRDRFCLWLKRWPIWEWALGGMFCVAFAVVAIAFDFWFSVLMGGVVGLTAAMIFFLTVVLALSERRDVVAAQYDRLIKDLQARGISDLAIEGGMPKLMGENWMPLFERQFGYEAYRSIAQQISTVEPGLLVKRNRVRDFWCDFFAHNARQHRGLIGSLYNLRQALLIAAVDKQALKSGRRKPMAPSREGFPSFQVVDRPSPKSSNVVEAELSDPCDDNALIHGNAEVDWQKVTAHIDQPESVGGPKAKQSSQPTVHLQAEKFDVNSLHASNLVLQVSPETLAELVQPDAEPFRSGSPASNRSNDESGSKRESSEDPRQRIRVEDWRNRFFGDEARLTVGIVTLILFGVWVYQSGLLVGESWQGIRDALLEFQPADFGTSVLVLVAALLSCPPSLEPLGVSGWGLAAASACFMTTSLWHGWGLTMFVVPAAITVLACFTAAFCYSADLSVVFIGIVVASGLIVAGIWRDKRLAAGSR